MLLTLKSRIGLALVVLLTAIALMAAACGGGDDDGDDGEPTDAPTAAPTDGGDDDGGDDDGGSGDGGDGAFEEVFPINQTFWHSGFMVEIGDAVHAGTEPDIFDEQVFTLTLEATFTNEGDDQTFFDAEVTMFAGGDTYSPQSDRPNVPGGGLSADGEFVFRVEEGFEIDDAYLIAGFGGDQQARVPLGPAGGELIALEPSEAPLTGAISSSLIDMNFTLAEVRADNPVNHREVEAEKLALTLNFDVTSRKSGNWSIFPLEFSLMLPSGSSVAVDGADLPGLPGSDDGLDTTGLYLRFIVDDPPEGTYTLRWVPPDRWIGEGDPAEETFEFEL